MDFVLKKKPLTECEYVVCFFFLIPIKKKFSKKRYGVCKSEV